MGNYNRNGNEYPSVTTVLQLVSKPHLVQWSANMATDYVLDHIEEIVAMDNVHHRKDLIEGARYAHDVYRKESAGIGTTAHELIENFIKTGDRNVPELTDAQKEIFDSFLEWNDQYNPTWLASEIELYSDVLGVAGTCDAICSINGEIWMIDFKTSKKVYPKDYALQLGAYSIAYRERGAEFGEIKRFAILHLDWRENATTIVDVTNKMAVAERSYKLLCDFYYSSAKRRVKNPRVKEFYP